MADHADHSHDAPPHKHGEMDTSQQEKTFEGFMKFWVLVFGVSAFVLIFLALFNT